jgi:hypothetical protein
MASTIYEFHGARPGSKVSRENAKKHHCPFVDKRCKKKNGACSLLLSESEEPVIICPNRLYGDGFKVIEDIANKTIERGQLISPEQAAELHALNQLNGDEAVVFGQGFGRELAVTAPAIEGERPSSFSVDYVMCALENDLSLNGFAAVEVQTIDTTNSYGNAAKYYYALQTNQKLDPQAEITKAGLNWENVNKRILPQIIYKGHTLRREVKAQHGLFFVLPDAVYSKILTRIGNDLMSYPKGPGTVTFETYRIGEEQPDGTSRLVHVDSNTTSVEQIAFAFVSPRNLPKLGIYENKIEKNIQTAVKQAAKRSKSR